MKHLITAALFLSTAMLTAQENKTESEDRPVTIRVKKIEKINGIEKTTDSTYTVKGPIKIDRIEEFASDRSSKESPKKIIIVTDEVHGDNVKVITNEGEMDEQMERALKAAGVDGKSLGIDKIMLLNDNVQVIGEAGDKKTTKIVIVKTIKITEPTKEEEKMLGRQTGIADQNLPVEQMNFYPNPSTGKFTLNFNLAKKGKTEISILNMEGKSVYKEELKDFSGTYYKDIDISENPKGVYFVKISQGDQSQVKKIILE